MKVGIVSYHRLNARDCNNYARQKTYTRTNENSLINLPIKDSFNSQVSFNGSRLPFSHLQNIPCPCCGKIMIPPNLFSKKLTAENLSGTSAKAIKVLSEFKDNMPDIEKLCFEKFEKISRTSPNKALAEIVKNLRDESLKKLKVNQFNVLRDINSMSANLSKDSVARIKALLKESKKIIEKDSPDNLFKRKTFIKKLFRITSEIPEKELGEKIHTKSFEIDNSENDVNAFIVKYSQRSSSEIGQRLVSKAVSTIEHIKPQVNKGENLDKNYLLECAGCNNSRMAIPLDEWIKNVHPEMPENTQKHFDFIIDLINQKKIKDFDDYPEEVAKTLEKESKGLIKIDTSRLIKNK